MVQEFLRRRLNPFLLISTVVVLAILAGLSVTYQDVLSEKVATNQQLRQTVEEKKSRISFLEEKTSNLTADLRSTEQDLAATINETQRQEERIEGLKSEVSSLEGTVDSLKTTIAEKNSTIDDLRSTIDQKTSTINDLHDSLEIVCGDSNNLTVSADNECEDWGYR